MDKEMLLLKAKRINTYNNKEQKEIYDEVIKNFDKFSESEQIDLLLIMRTYFLKQATLVEKREYVKKVVISIKKQSNFIAQIIELSSIIYKYTTKSLQNEIFDAVFLVNDMKPRILVAILYFIKNTHRVYNKKQFDISRKKIEEITKEAPEYLTDAITSLNNDISKDFKKKGKYLFLIPEFLNGTTFVQPPLALMNCATYLKNDFSIDVDILDNRIYNYPLKDLLNIIRNYKKGIVICSSTIDQVHNYFVDYRYVIFTKYVKTIKGKFNNIPIIICGGQGTVRPDIVFNDCNPDYILKGEFDIQLANVIRNMDKNVPIENLPNIIYKEKKKIIKTREDLNEQHPVEWCKYVPNYNLIHLECYFGYRYYDNMPVRKLHWSVVQASRGCPFNCAFCYNFFAKSVRFRKIDSVIAELKEIQERGIEEIFFLDQNFILDKKYAQNLCKAMINTKIRIKWQCQICVNSIDYDTLSVMKKAGCQLIWLGIESFDENVRKINNKNYSNEQLLKAVVAIKNAGINYNGFFMLGMMGDTNESMGKTVELIKKHKINLTKSILICTPRFDTQMYQETVKQLGTEIDSFLKLDSYKGSINNNVTESDISYYLGELLKMSNDKKGE